MTPLFPILVLLAGVLLWLLLSFMFIPLGKMLSKVAKNVKDVITKEDKEQNEQKGENE